MRHIKTVLILLLFIAVLPVCAYADTLNRPNFDNTSVIVVTKPMNALFKLKSTASADAIFNELGITDITRVASLPSTEVKSDFSLFSLPTGDREILKLTLPQAGDENVIEAVDKLNASGAVSAAQPNYYYYLDDDFTTQSVPNDSFYNKRQNSLKVVGAEKVWDYNIDCSNVKIAIIDSGLMIEHEDLKDNIWQNTGEIANNGIDDDKNGYIDDIHGWDFTTSSSQNNDPTNPVDPYYEPYLNKEQGHGTHVAGIADAVTDNKIGIASLAGNAKLIGLRAFDDKASSSTAWVCAAMSYAGLIGCDIVNCSWGVYRKNHSDVAIEETIKSCPNTLFTCAAGNAGISIDNNNYTILPGAYGLDNTLCVASSTSNDTLSSFSNYGTVNIDLAAPGENAPGVKIYSTGNTNLRPDSYIEFRGTSQSAPLVASTAAVLKGRYPSLTPAMLKRYIIYGCDHPSTLSYTDSRNNTRTITDNRRLNAAKSIYLADMDFNGNNVTLTDENGSIIKLNDTPKEINAQIDFISSDDIKPSENANIIIAVYTENDTLAGIISLTPDLTVYSNTLSGTLYLDGNTAIKKVNMLIWSSIDGMKPLRESKIIMG